MHREESPRARPADAENRGMNAWIHCKRFDSPNVTEAAGLTQWGSSWRRERVPVKTTGMQKPQIRKNCGNLWKSQKAPLFARRGRGATRHPQCPGHLLLHIHTG